MANIIEHFDKENLHHAYLIEGDREEVYGLLAGYLRKYFGASEQDPDFCHILVDSFKIDSARELKSMSRERALKDKKFFIISTNHITLDAQNTMLKLFEEPIEGTHFFVITPDFRALLPTLISRFYVISEEKVGEDRSLAENFINQSPQARLETIKEICAKPDDDIAEDSIRAKALKFLNLLEETLYLKNDTKKFLNALEQIFIVRKHLRQPGSSPKMLLESVALSI